MTQDEWFLAGSIMKGKGRSWLIHFYHLTHINPDESHMATDTLARAKEWLERMAGVPIKYERQKENRALIFCYCLDRYVEGGASDGKE